MGFGQRHHIAAGLLLLFAAIAAGAPVSAQTLDADGVGRRDAAVLAARGGDYAQALSALDALRAEFPDDLSLRHDQATVHAWAENDAAAVELASNFDPVAAPRYAQLAIAKSARNLRRFDVAAQWYEAAIAANPDDTDALSGRLLTAADAGDAATSRRLIDATAMLAAEHTEIALAQAYALLALGDSLAALRRYERIIDFDPAHRDALRGKALALRAMLLPTQALELAAANPGILSDTEIERLRADEAAIQTRLTARTPYPEPAIYAGSDRSLEFIEAQLASAATDSARNSLLLDRVVALSDAQRSREAIEAFESLPASANRDQAYVLTAAANAYLQERQPEVARDLLLRTVELAPENLEAQFLLVYAWLDLDRYEEAHALATRLTAELPMVRQAASSNVIKGNDSRIRAELVAGITDADGNQLDAAQARFETLLREAPNNGELRQELAHVYRWRGWLDRALEQYRQVLTMNDESIDARVGLAHTQLDGREYAAVDATVRDVSNNYTREPAVQQLAERWELHNQRELIVAAESGDSSGPVVGANHYAIDTRWFTAPLGYRYRAFVATHDGYAEFPEGEARRRRIGAGIEYRLPRFTATASVSGSRSGGSAGFGASVDYRRNDFWSFSGGLEGNTDAAQLRAQRLDIEADRAYFSANYAPNELSALAIGLDRTRYDDGNALDALALDGRRRILNRPRSGLDVTGSLQFGRADTDAVPYYSPTSSRTAMVGLRHALRLHRRYERELNQTVSIATGRTEQHGFDSGSIWSAAYRIDWAISRRHGLGLEAQRHGQFFDGAREHASVVLITLNSRF